jgi:hypothetical protein
MHRRTHKNRLFAAPLVDLPNIAGTHLIIPLSAAEELLNRAMKDKFVEKVNSKFANGKNRRKRANLEL